MELHISVAFTELHLLWRSFIWFIEIYKDIHKCYPFMKLYKIHACVALIVNNGNTRILFHESINAAT